MTDFFAIARAVLILASCVMGVAFFVPVTRQYFLSSNKNQRIAVALMALVVLVSAGAATGWVCGLKSGVLVGIVGHLAGGLIAMIFLVTTGLESVRVQLESTTREETEQEGKEDLEKLLRQLSWTNTFGFAGLLLGVFGAPLIAILAEDRELKLLGLLFPFFAMCLAIFAFAAISHRAIAMLMGVFALVIFGTLIGIRIYDHYQQEREVARAAAQAKNELRNEQLRRLSDAVSPDPWKRLTLVARLIRDGSLCRIEEEKSDASAITLSQAIADAADLTGTWRATVSESGETEMTLQIDADRQFSLETTGDTFSPPPITGTFAATERFLSFDTPSGLYSISR